MPACYDGLSVLELTPLPLDLHASTFALKRTSPPNKFLPSWGDTWFPQPHLKCAPEDSRVRCLPTTVSTPTLMKNIVSFPPIKTLFQKKFLFYCSMVDKCLPRWLRVKEFTNAEETHIRSFSQEDLLEEQMATHSVFLPWRNSLTKEPGLGYSPWRCRELDTTECACTHVVGKQGLMSKFSYEMNESS